MDPFYKNGNVQRFQGYMNVYNYAKAIEAYEHNKPKFRKLKPISGIFYLRLQALDYIFEGMVPLLKTYIDENATDAEKAKGFQLTMKSERFCEENNLISYQVACLNNIATMQYWMGDLNAYHETRLKMDAVAKSTGNKLYYASTLSGLQEVL